jgi:hypothetical protein
MNNEENNLDMMKCGIIMPISEMDGCGEHHWREVRNILSDAIKTAGFEAELVSEADDVGIIQKRIIQNIYENPIVVCDVSGKNPNVMFELGLRLAFDKPTIIIKDDKTNYSFDTAPIEHLTYPRDLRYSKIIEFKDKLSLKISGTYEKSCSDHNYTTFLKNFGEFTSPKLETKEISKEDFIIEELKELKKQLMTSNRRQLELFERNERVHMQSRERDYIMNELENRIHNEIVNQKSVNPDSDNNELREFLLNDSSIRELIMRTGISKSMLLRIVDKALEQYCSRNKISSEGRMVMA